ncbi:MAG: ABC transporter substrate-binding protein [Halomonas sp.]|nr:ABC transporter substrate-binding protein [Halomonas sp.]MCC5900832.1 ABC transporter substrate-binding protein [Halomonas sp.]
MKTLWAKKALTYGALAIITLVGGASAYAEERGEISIAQQFGIGYLLLDVIQEQALIEKHGREQGIDIDVEWRTISGATAMNEALLSGSLDVVSAGVPPMLTVWDRTQGRQNVKAIAALGSLPNHLLTNNPDVQDLEDFSDQDRIAVPAAGVGFQSRTLQIEAARRFGAEDFQRFDQISVSIPHAEATAALMSGHSEISAHFSSPPFLHQALENPNVRSVISSYDILGGPATFNVLYTTEAYREENPKTYRAFYDALIEAAEIINSDKDAAAETFINVQQSRLDPELVRSIINDPEITFTAFPERTFIYAEELHNLGVLEHQAESWQDYFFEEAHEHPGS